MKKFIAALGIFTLILGGMVGCGSTKEGAMVPGTPAPEAYQDPQTNFVIYDVPTKETRFKFGGPNDEVMTLNEKI